MINFLSLMLIFSFISLLLIMINFLLSKKMLTNREKISPFECGFDPLNNTRMPFSIQFFLISLIFLIFDIEITLIIPFILFFNYLNKIMVMSSIFFMIILIFGLYLEYMDQSLDWKN